MRVRFAPSPTGYLHVGGARTALFNWLLARKDGGRMVLRIEDTDRERSSEEHTRAILHGLEWLGLDWDEGPVHQSDGAGRHRADAVELLERGLAYRDFTAPDELRERAAARGIEDPSRLARELADAMDPDEVRARVEAGEPHAVRFRVPEGETAWDDLVHGEMRFENNSIDDLVILRSDGSATYNMAVVSDDARMGVTHVIRGDDHLSNTPKQILLYRALGQELPTFGHVPMILGSDGKRLSKRHGATAVGEYEHQGILPEAMMNFLALLGWSPGDDREIFTPDELVEAFSMDRVLKKSAVFDLEKLAAINGKHLSRSPPERLVPLVTPILAGEGLASEEELEARRDWYFELIDALKARARSVHDIADQAVPYLVDELSYDPGAVKKHWRKDPDAARERLEALRERLAGVEWRAEPLEGALRGLADEMDVGAGKLIHPLRVALTGQAVSPGIFRVLALVGREKSLRRMERAAEMLREKSLS